MFSCGTKMEYWDEIGERLKYVSTKENLTEIS